MLQDRRSENAQRVRLIPAADDLHAPGAATVFKVGNDLKVARTRLGWALDAIASHLRIRESVLRAIEEGRLSELPASAYTIGFVRTYAGALGLDADEVARRFRAEAAALTRRPDLDFPAPVPDRGMPAGAAVLLGTMLAVVAYAGWYRMSETRPVDERVRQVPQRLADLVQPPAPPPHAPAPPAVVAVAPSPPPAPPPVTQPPLPPTAAAAAIPAAGVFGPPLAVTPVPAGAGLPPLPEGTRIVLRARADAWLQVRDRQGPVLLNRVLRTGETWPVPPGKAPAQLLLTTGNAGGTEVLVDGQLTPALGNDGAVRRDLALDPDAIRDGRLAPPPARAPGVKR